MQNYETIGMTLMIAFVITALICPIFIPILKWIKAGQSIREDGPKSHLVKSGTPTMGGIVIIGAVIVACLTQGVMKREMLIILVSFFAFGALGFTDDFVKVAMKRNLGLRAYQKLTMQVLIAVAIAYFNVETSEMGTSLFVPFLNIYWDLGNMYIPFVVFVIVAMTNSVNLTDGLDGLAAGVTSLVALFLAVVGITVGDGNVAVFCAAMAGACIGFLIFNRHPAKIFMGDTGSLALGGGIAVAAILMNMALIIPLAGGIFVAEALSVVIQVFSFKTRGKRVFKMAPLHHHFELSGWGERKIVGVFWSITLLLCLTSVTALFISNL
jgi:phospho-N-acetylmuramoyl-pentapeptide-transferase